MNARELVFKDDPLVITDIWQCATCRMVWHSKGWLGHEETPEAAANRCCNHNCDDCGKPVDQQGWIVCRACRASREQTKEDVAFAKAKKVTLAEYEGEFIYRDGLSDDGYVRTEDVTDEIEDALGDGGTPPTYAWGTSANHASFDLLDTLESHVGDNHHENAWDNADTMLLKAAQVIVDKALEDVVSYEEDHKVAVLLPTPIRDEEGNVVRWDEPRVPTEERVASV